MACVVTSTAAEDKIQWSKVEIFKKIAVMQKFREEIQLVSGFYTPQIKHVFSAIWAPSYQVHLLHYPSCLRPQTPQLKKPRK